MKRLLSLSLVLVCIACIVLPATTFAQSTPQSQSFQQTWGSVTGTGPLGTARNYRVFGVVPSNYTIDWFNDHTAANSCTFQVEGSSDNVHWHALTGVTDCTGSDMIHIAEKPVMYLRINILSYGAGDLSTAVFFSYTRGN